MNLQTLVKLPRSIDVKIHSATPTLFRLGPYLFGGLSRGADRGRFISGLRFRLPLAGMSIADRGLPDASPEKSSFSSSSAVVKEKEKYSASTSSFPSTPLVRVRARARVQVRVRVRVRVRVGARVFSRVKVRIGVANLTRRFIEPSRP